VRTASYTVDPVIEEVVKVLPLLVRDLVNLAAGPKLAQGLVGRPRLPAHHPEARHPRAEPRYR
jgi:hypothetical protein